MNIGIFAAIVAAAVRALPHSVRIWLKAADIEIDMKDKKKVSGEIWLDDKSARMEQILKNILFDLLKS